MLTTGQSICVMNLMDLVQYFLAYPPTVAAWFVLGASILVVLGGVVGTRQSFAKPTDNVALAYGTAGLLAVLGLLAVGQGAYAIDMMGANAAVLDLPGAARPALMAAANARARTGLFFAGAGSAVALLIASFLFLRYVYLRRERLPEGTRHSFHPLESGSFPAEDANPRQQAG